MKTLEHKWIGPYIVLVHSEKNPTNEEWSQMLGGVPSQYAGCLVYTAGGVPSAAQRKLLREKIQSINAYTAVLSDSPVARLVITALNLFLRNPLQAFAPNDVDQALSYMRVPEEQRPELKSTLLQLKSALHLH